MFREKLISVIICFINSSINLSLPFHYFHVGRFEFKVIFSIKYQMNTRNVLIYVVGVYVIMQIKVNYV